MAGSEGGVRTQGTLQKLGSLREYGGDLGTLGPEP